MKFSNIFRRFLMPNVHHILKRHSTLTKNYDTSNVRFVNDIDTSNKMGINPLINAARLGNAKIVEKLINAGADVNATNKMGFTAIAKAAQIGHLEIVRILVDAGAKLDIPNKYGPTIASIASTHGHTQIAQFIKFELLYHNAEKDQYDEQKKQHFLEPSTMVM